jgi:hypothetical protein
MMNLKSKLSVKFRVGCQLVPSLSWKNAPHDCYVIGLKELPENDNSPLCHSHIFFAHCFKNQAGWKDILNRFVIGKGTILDLEFLNDENGDFELIFRSTGCSIWFLCRICRCCCWR